MKKKIIALLAGATAVATVGGSFAAWDKFEDAKSAKVELNKPVSIDVSALSFSQGVGVSNETEAKSSAGFIVTPTENGTVTFDTILCKVEFDLAGACPSGSAVNPSSADAVVTKEAGGAALVAPESVAANETSTYKLTVTAKDRDLYNNLFAQVKVTLTK